MRVALVCPYDLDVPGGVQSHVLHLAARLRAAGDEVRVLAPGSGRTSRPGVHVLGGSLAVRFNDSVAPIALSPAAGARTVAALRAFAPHVVHVHEPAVPTVALAATLGAEARVVATFHAWSARGRAYRAARPFLRPVVAHIDRAIAVSAAAADYHARALGRPPGWFAVVPNGVDTARFAEAPPADLGATASDGPVVLFVGRLEPRKGIDVLLRAFLLLKSRRSDVRLVVVGDGPARGAAEDSVPARLRDDVLFTGRVEQDDLPGYYRAADVFVSPALGGESFGIVLIEAMAAGVPVVASDIPGYAAVLRDGRDGVLSRPGDAEALADVLEGLLATPARVDALAAQGREAAARFDWSIVAERLRSLYVEALEH